MRFLNAYRACQSAIAELGWLKSQSISLIHFLLLRANACNFFYIHNQSTDNIVDIIFKIFHNDASNSFDNSISLYLANIL